jgi:hypothetical protein
MSTKPKAATQPALPATFLAWVALPEGKPFAHLYETRKLARICKAEGERIVRASVTVEEVKRE